MIQLNKHAEYPRVLLARDGVFNRSIKDGGKGLLEALIKDWLRIGWPVIVHPKYHQQVCGALTEAFYNTGSGGGVRFPVCWCFVPPGKHDKCRIYTNISGLEKRLFECSELPCSPEVEGQCNKKVFDATIRRISSAHVPSSIRRSSHHLYGNPIIDGNEAPKKAARRGPVMIPLVAPPCCNDLQG